MKTMICVVCPRGCRLSVADEDPSFPVTGNACPRGEAYGRAELRDPRRIVTATARAVRESPGSINSERERSGTIAPYAPRRVPVKTSGGVPRARVQEIASFMQGLDVRLPVKEGDIVAKNWEGIGVDIVVTRSMD
jgi:CxxC motif-containing protein